MTSHSYGSRFYASRDRETRYAADRILNIVLPLTRPRSLCDVGCGVGTWLRAAREQGVTDVFGFEGEWLDRSMLVVEPALVSCRDLEQPLHPDRRADLALCLEVAEHLSATRGRSLVQDLVRISDAVLFSAAIPDQGGAEHRNERWQSYWAGLFAEHGYGVFDVVRAAVWLDEGIPFWYRQNTLLYVRRDTDLEAALGGTAPAPPLLDTVHPRLYVEKLMPTPYSAAVLVLRAVGRGLGWRPRPPLPVDGGSG